MMALSVEQLQEMCTEYRRHKNALEKEAKDALDEWVGEQVALCRDSSGEISRASVHDCGEMNHDLFRVLCLALNAEGRMLAAFANRYLAKHRNTPNLIRFEAVNMGKPSIRLFYKY